jgi:hypothetical protein
VLILRRIKQHLVNHNILVPEQYSFQDGISTDTATYKLIETIFSTWNKKEYIAGILCDLVKTSDCVNHKLLLSKWKFHRLRGVILEWFELYMNNRKQIADLEFIKPHSYYNVSYLPSTNQIHKYINNQQIVL